MTPDSWGGPLLPAMGKAGPGRVTDGPACHSYWAPSITEAGRNWGTAQRSPLPSLLPAPRALAQLRTARDGAHWAPKCSSTAWSDARCDQRAAESRMVWVGWILNPSSSSPCTLHGPGCSKPYPGCHPLLSLGFPSKKATSCISLLDPFKFRPVWGVAAEQLLWHILQMRTATPSTSSPQMCPALAHPFRNKPLFRQNMAEIQFFNCSKFFSLKPELFWGQSSTLGLAQALPPPCPRP